MIVFDLQCRDGGETFEAWFRSSADYEEQRAAGLVQCPFCRSANVDKAPMAPRVPRKGGDQPARRAGRDAGRDARRIRAGSATSSPTRRAPCTAARSSREQVHGNATLEQAKSLVDEGVPVAPLPLPVVPPEPGELIAGAAVPYSVRGTTP